MSQFTPPSEVELREWATGKAIIITGGAQGIGFGVAQLFANAGAKVVIADIDETVGKQAQESLGSNSLFVRCNVTSWKDQVQLFQTAIANFNRIDLVISNAGINPELVPSNGSKYDYLVDKYRDGESDKLESLEPPITSVFDVNITGVLYNLRLAMHHMIANGGGRIVVMGSAASYMGFDDHALYCASKHAILGLVRATSLRKECTDNNISVSVVAPWVTQTRMTQAFIDHLPTSISISSPGDVAAAIAISATQPIEKIRGKSIWVQGKTYTEVEDVITACQGKLIL
ncbi:uncharacterized protein TRIVIDRAFT_151220 [Trichoderma virens Gv29-8]|uniref:Uncharacterized protein n=1 Tax=Hypocrea virens (strain Gv29-8 / FGSC 10586) TaxID=413071 RepID=G9MU01_HYPVG|nr:uncharacterized protein TRIVIDRAFT_151220 [Trichoderma virens Gv29-8]EHK22078.1 hypothetical protein TRIVIDRAFT_151220 [Trichoderma virens Gv29-8]UKZ55869.1 hypothetical protein TrVGV298_009693 [Trichoderma virens]UKZ81626.1 hypothetical protein TrVFT333_009398 [Trichoderma virens FT-333]